MKKFKVSFRLKSDRQTDIKCSDYTFVEADNLEEAWEAACKWYKQQPLLVGLEEECPRVYPNTILMQKRMGTGYYANISVEGVSQAKTLEKAKRYLELLEMSRRKDLAYHEPDMSDEQWNELFDLRQELPGMYKDLE